MSETKYVIQRHERTLTAKPMALIAIITIVSFFVGSLWSNDSAPVVREDGTNTALLVALSYTQTPTATNTPLNTVTPSSTPTVTTTPTVTPTDELAQYDYCRDVEALTPCIPYGTQVPKTPTSTPTATPIPFCTPKMYKTDYGQGTSNNIICLKPLPTLDIP